MAIGGRCRFDDNNQKYWHGCCHIRTAAVIIGTIQLMCFLYELSNSAAIASRAQRYMQKYKNQLNGSLGGLEQSADKKSQPDNIYADPYRTYNSYNGDPFEISYWSENTGRPSGRLSSAGAADVTWHALSALAVVLLFYAVRFTRPYLLAPKFIFDAIAAGLATINAATMMAMAMGRPFTVGDQLRSAIVAATIIASINLYFFWITMRCFKYLLEKRAFLDSAVLNDSFLSLPTFGMFDLPTFTTTSPNHPADRPPAYLTVVQEQPTVIKPADPKPAGNDESVPPTYEEAERLRQAIQSSSENEQQPQPQPSNNNNA